MCAEGEGCFRWGFTFCTQRCGLNVLVLWIIKSFGELFSATQGPKYDCSFQTLNCHSLQNKSREDTGFLFKEQGFSHAKWRFSFFIPGMHPWHCVWSIYCWEKCSGIWQEGCRQWSAVAATVLQRVERTVTTVSLPEVPAAEMKHKSVPESVSTQTTEKMLTLLVLVTHSSCSANYGPTHPSENHSSSKALGVVVLCQLKYTGCYRAKPLLTATGAASPVQGHSQTIPSVHSALCWPYQSTGADASMLRNTRPLHYGHNPENIRLGKVCLHSRSCLFRNPDTCRLPLQLHWGLFSKVVLSTDN